MLLHTDTLKYDPLDLQGLDANFKNTVCSNINNDSLKLSFILFLICS